MERPRQPLALDMLHALLHGKLDLELPEPHRREDALTSIVFGTLRMVEAWDVLANWLDAEPLSSGQEGTGECWFGPASQGPWSQMSS